MICSLTRRSHVPAFPPIGRGAFALHRQSDADAPTAPSRSSPGCAAASWGIIITSLESISPDTPRKRPGGKIIAASPTAIRPTAAKSDEAGHHFQYEAGHLFRSEAGQRSDLKPDTFGLPPQVRIDDVSLVLIGQGCLDLAAIMHRL
jgi:hypothetical protein